MDGTAKGYSGSHSGLRCKRKYRQIKTADKLSEKMLGGVCIPLRELYLSSHKALFEHCSCKTKKVIFGAHWRLWRKVKCRQIKPRKKHSKKLLSDMWIHFTELKLTLHFPVWKVCLWGFCEGVLSGNWRPVVSKEMSSLENWREAFWATLLWCLYSSDRVKSFFGLSILKSLFLWNLRKDIWERSLEYAEKGILSDKNQKECFCETTLCHVNSACRVNLLFPLSSILTL